MAAKSLDIILGARDRASPVLKAVRANLMGMQSSLASIGGFARSALGFLGIGLGLKAIFEGAAEAEASVTNLGAALKLAGEKDVPTAVKSMTEFASKIQAVTTLGDEAVLQLATVGVNLGKFTGEGLKAATVAAIGLGARLKIDVESAMKLITKAAKGNTETLSRYGLVLKGTLTPQEKFNELMRIGGESFALAEADARTMGGRIKQLKEVVGDLGEAIGLTLIDLLPRGMVSATSSVAKLTAAIGPLGRFIKSELIPPVEALAGLFVGTFTTIAGVVGEAVTTTAGFLGDGLHKTLSLTGDSVTTLKDRFVQGFVVMEFVVRNFKGVINLAITEVQFIIEKFANQMVHLFTEVIPKSFDFMMSKLSGGTAKVGSSVLRTIQAAGIGVGVAAPGLQKFIDPITSKAGTGANVLGVAGDVLGNSQLNIAPRLPSALETALQDEIKKSGAGMADNFLDFFEKRLREIAGLGAQGKGTAFELPKMDSITAEAEAKKKGTAASKSDSPLGPAAAIEARFLTGIGAGSPMQKTADRTAKASEETNRKLTDLIAAVRAGGTGILAATGF